MTPDRALELAESALHDRRSYAKHHGLPQLEAECEDALRVLADVRATMPTEAPQSASEGKREVYLRDPLAVAPKPLRTA